MSLLILLTLAPTAVALLWPHAEETTSTPAIPPVSFEAVPSPRLRPHDTRPRRVRHIVIAPVDGMPIVVPDLAGLSMPLLRPQGDFPMPMLRPDARPKILPRAAVSDSVAVDTTARKSTPE